MKNSFILENYLDTKFNKILDFDKREIDNPDKYNPTRLRYLDRLNKIISLIQKMFPIPDQIKVGDFACAQGNMSLILAELGYTVFATDINLIYIEYSKIKYERGKIEWINDNIENLNFTLDSLDVAIAGELIEHCAHPEEIIKKIFNFIKPGGILIITTPNGSRILSKLPTYKEIFPKEKNKLFEKKQFGPDGEDHLFLFKLNEIKDIIPKEAIIIEQGYLGGIKIINKYSYHFLRLFPVKKIENMVRRLSKISLINKKLFNNIYVVLKKNNTGVTN